MQLLIRMVALGLGAWDMIDSQLFKEPKLVSFQKVNGYAFKGRQPCQCCIVSLLKSDLL